MNLNNPYKIEIWKDINGFNNYRISSKGRVLNKVTCKYLKSYGNGTKKNYQKVKLTADDGTTQQIYVHKLVAETFIRPLQEGEEVNHFDNDPLNNHLPNLELCSKKQNGAHKILNRLFEFEDTRIAKLTLEFWLQ